MAKQVTEAQLDKMTQDTGEVLKKQPKVKVKLHLPQEELNKLRAQEEAGKSVAWPFRAVSVNGYIYQIQLGKTVEVPETVAEILEQAGLI